MMFPCLVSAQYNMWVTVLSQDVEAPVDPGSGSWVEKQDPDTGEIERVWVPEDEDTETPGVQERKIPCSVRGIISSGVTDIGTTERYTAAGIYDNIDYARMKFPAGIILSKRDRVTNVVNSDGVLIWQEEEMGIGVPTVFDVLGVTPVTDPFGGYVENSALLKRAEVQ